MEIRLSCSPTEYKECQNLSCFNKKIGCKAVYSWLYVASAWLQARGNSLPHSILIFLFDSVVHQEEFDISGALQTSGQSRQTIMVHQNLASICCILPLVSQHCIMGSQFVNLCRHQIYS